jgi:hypothetical protein
MWIGVALPKFPPGLRTRKEGLELGKPSRTWQRPQQPEAAHNVYIRYRSKSLQLERLHYCISAHLAVLQSATNWASEVYGSKYYWLKELYARLNLPVTDGMLKNIESMLAIRGKALESQKSEAKKKYRVRMKKARLEENEERKRWLKH